MKELVSIIMPAFNSAQFIGASIESVRRQIYQNWELIIIDDGSSDDTINLIKKYQAQDSRIELIINAENLGPGKSRNKGIVKAKGQFLTFLDSDDIWFDNFITDSINFEKQSEGFVFSSYRRGDEFTLKPIHKDFIVPVKVNYHDILKTNSISCLTAFINIHKLGKKLMPEVLYRQDMGLWLSYLKDIKYAYGNQEVLAIYRIRKKSHSRNKWSLLKPQWQFYRNVENLSFVHTIYIMMVWAIKGLIKYR